MMKRSILSIAAVLAAIFAVAAVPAPEGSEYAETTTDVYFHRSDCGSNSDRFYIDLEDSTDAGDGCGTLGGVSQVITEAFIAAGEDSPFTQSYPNDVPLELRLDGSRDLEGVITMGQFTIETNAGNVYTGAGKTDVTLEFIGKVGGQFVDLGTASGSTTVPPGTGTYEVPFTLDLDDELHGETLTSLNVEVTVRGVAVNQDYIHYSGASKFTLPTLDVVESTS